MEIKRYLRVVASTGDDDDDYSMVEISNRRAKEAADRIEQLEAALRKYADEEYNGYNADGAHARKALEGKDD